MIAAGGAAAAPITLSLNTSVLYIGFGIGSSLGAAIVERQGVAWIGLAAAAAEAIALFLFAFYGLIQRRSDWGKR
jgi:predicted MFS family arabinose efflux permease